MNYKSFKNLFSFALLVALTAGGFYQAAAQNNKRQTALIARQKSYFEAVIKKDCPLLDAMLAADYIGGSASGIIDKQRESKDLREFPLKEFQMSELKTLFPNSKTGVIIFKLNVTVIYEGKEFSEDDIMNCLWTRRGKNWLLAAQTAVKFVKST